MVPLLLLVVTASKAAAVLTLQLLMQEHIAIDNNLMASLWPQPLLPLLSSNSSGPLSAGSRKLQL